MHLLWSYSVLLVCIRLFLENKLAPWAPWIIKIGEQIRADCRPLLLSVTKTIDQSTFGLEFSHHFDLMGLIDVFNWPPKRQHLWTNPSIHALIAVYFRIINRVNISIQFRKFSFTLFCFVLEHAYLYFSSILTSAFVSIIPVATTSMPALSGL